MRLKQPRIPALTPEQFTKEQADALGPSPPNGRLNVILTMINHPALYKAWLPFGSHVMSGTSLPKRDREILIIRAGVLCRSGYEVAQHSEIGRQVGLTQAEIEAIHKGPDAPGWSEFDRTLLRAADELVTDHFISDPTWAALSKRYSRIQLMDAVFAVGHYILVSIALNSFGVQIEPDVAKLWRR